jgi:hypothetical protein
VNIGVCGWTVGSPEEGLFVCNHIAFGRVAAMACPEEGGGAVVNLRHHTSTGSLTNEVNH